MTTFVRRFSKRILPSRSTELIARPVGVEQFSDSTILVSGHSPSFISRANLPEHSLCSFLDISTPSYTPKLVPHDTLLTSPTGASLGLCLLHTPGHTPDELALWNEDERMLYVGDTLYEHAPIIFPNEGSIVQWFASVEWLIKLVQGADARRHGPDAPLARINAGHVTAGRPALDVLLATEAFMRDVISGKESVKDRRMKRGEPFVEYVQDDGRFRLQCPERLVLEARHNQF
jgi:glyoxylase-like metal-dependent hydrolase (beta-lactamase superfamily II)